MPNSKGWQPQYKPTKKYHRRKRAPLLLRRSPWILLGLLICLALFYFVPGFQDIFNQTSRETSAPIIANEALKQLEIEEITELITNIEHDVVELVNGIRYERQAAPLIWDDELYQYSKEHSEDMAACQELFHTPIDRLYGENVWSGEGRLWWDADDIVEGWMTSDEHRTWLLCPHLTNIAVGIALSENTMYASWTFWRHETQFSDWWYMDSGRSPPDWWY